MIDRFYSISSACAMTLTEDGVQLVSNNGNHALFRQKIENPELLFGQTVTLSVLRSDGTLSSKSNTIPDGFQTSEITLIQADFWTLRIASSSLYVTYSNNSTTVPRTYKAIKLELGSVQTLAHQDVDGNWVLNDPPPNKGTELAKCQRYQVELLDGNRYGSVGIGFGHTTTRAGIYIDLPVNVRIASPTLVYSGNFALSSDLVIGNELLVSKLELSNPNNTKRRAFLLAYAENVVPGETYVLRAANDSNARLLLDYNL